MAFRLNFPRIRWIVRLWAPFFAGICHVWFPIFNECPTHSAYWSTISDPISSHYETLWNYLTMKHYETMFSININPLMNSGWMMVIHPFTNLKMAAGHLEVSLSEGSSKSSRNHPSLKCFNRISILHHPALGDPLLNPGIRTPHAEVSEMPWRHQRRV